MFPGPFLKQKNYNNLKCFFFVCIVVFSAMSFGPKSARGQSSNDIAGRILENVIVHFGTQFVISFLDELARQNSSANLIVVEVSWLNVRSCPSVRCGLQHSGTSALRNGEVVTLIGNPRPDLDGRVDRNGKIIYWAPVRTRRNGENFEGFASGLYLQFVR
jgi:hypothetical protein